MTTLLRLLGYVWTAPNTLLGMIVGLFSMPLGARVQLVDGVIEFHSGPIAWLLERAPIDGGASAMTIGHVVWGRTAAALDITRRHERVHVEQYVRWGPMFLPAYGVASLVAWSQGESAYRGNYFEREAYAVDAPDGDYSS